MNKRYIDDVEMKKMVHEYIIKNSGKIDILDITHHFCKPSTVSMDVPAKCAYALIDEGKVRRVLGIGFNYVFEAI